MMTVNEYMEQLKKECEESKKNSDIEYDCNDIEIPDYVILHIEKFGVPPVFIGATWDLSEEEIKNNILKSIEKGKPYNENDFYSKKELKDIVF